MHRDKKLERAFKRHVEGTAPDAVVTNILVADGALPATIVEMIGVVSPRVYIATRVLKHLYDKRPAEEFDFLLKNLPFIAAQPDHLYRNKTDKRGQFCLTKRIGAHGYFAALEIVEGICRKEIQLVTAFRVRSEPYLNEYDLLWSRRDGATRSS